MRQATPSARFDDLRGADGSFELTGACGQFVATGVDEVAAVVDAAEDAARSGLWVAGFVAYEAAPAFDPQLQVTERAGTYPLAGLPLAWFAAFHERRDVAPPPARTSPALPWRLDEDEHSHHAHVGAIRDGIAAGSYYQVNLTARLSAQVDDVGALYAAIATAQQGGFNALLRTGEFTVASCSPELFFEHDGDRLRTRPMKGTAPRGRWPEEDRRQARALQRSAKDRAENAMIVDLMRNDVARVAATGTVTVPALFELERFPTVWQLTSTVAARTRPGVGLLEMFRAMFPSGSVTGAPKRAAMREIAALEQRPRGVYCGAIGYLEPGSRPRARFGVAIRTVTRADATGYAEYGSGGGITWSSDAAAEWQELRTKTRVLAARVRPTALLETMRLEPAHGIRNLERHLNRLAASADHLGLPFDRDRCTVAVRSAVASVAHLSRVRLVLHDDGAVQVDVSDLVDPAVVVRLAVADVTVHSGDITLFHKGADRSWYTAVRACRPDVDDVVLLNERGEVTETTIANLAVRLGDTWCTPPLNSGLLPGVERGRLLETGALAERVITVDELRATTEVAVLSSLRGLRPARLTDQVTSC